MRSITQIDSCFQTEIIINGEWETSPSMLVWITEKRTGGRLANFDHTRWDLCGSPS